MHTCLAFLLITCLPALSALPFLPSRSASNYVKFSVVKRTSTVGSGSSSEPFTARLNNQRYSYTIDVTIGTPPQPLSLLLDTGSADIWAYSPKSAESCPTCTDTYYDPDASSTEVDRGDLGTFNISYVSAMTPLLGYYVSDLFSVGDISVEQVIGVATSANPNDPPGGIFGIGLSAAESQAERGGLEYSGFIDTLAAAGLIETRAYSIYLDDITAGDETPGTIIFGGYDSSRYYGDLVPFPLIIPSPRGVPDLDISEPSIVFSLGGEDFAVPPSASDYTVVLDTGTATTRIPVDQFVFLGDAVNAKVTINSDTGQVSSVTVDCALATEAGGIDYTFSNGYSQVTIQVPWEQVVISDPTLPEGVCVFGVWPNPSGAGEYLFGDTFLRSAYIYFDYDAGTASLAQAKYDHGG